MYGGASLNVIFKLDGHLASRDFMELSQNQLKHFKEEGFLLIRNALTDNDLDAVVQEYEKHIDQRANELLDQGKLSQLYKDQPFERRLVCICKENNEIYPELDIMHLRGKASFDFLRNKNLMKIVTSIVGTEFTCSPIQVRYWKIIKSGVICGSKHLKTVQEFKLIVGCRRVKGSYQFSYQRELSKPNRFVTLY